MNTNKDLSDTPNPEEIERIINELKEPVIETKNEFPARKRNIFDELDIDGAELIAEPLHNIISHLARFSPYFRDNGFVVTMSRSYIKTTYLVIDGVWLHPLRITKGKAKDKLVIDPEKLEGYRLLYKEPVTQYIFRNYGFSTPKLFGIDTTSTEWIKYFTDTFDHARFIVSFIQNEFKVEYNNFFVNNNKSYVVVRALGRFLKKVYSTYNSQSTKFYSPNLKVFIGCGSDEALFYWVSIVDKYSFFYDDEAKTFKIKRGSLDKVKIYFTMSMDDFLNKGFVPENDYEVASDFGLISDKEEN